MKATPCILLAAIGSLLCVSAPAAAVAPAAAGCPAGDFCAWSAPNYTGSRFVTASCGYFQTSWTSTGSWIANEPAGDKVVFRFRNGTTKTYPTPAHSASFDWSAVLASQIVC
ncbi:MAG TPA: peptidase inhibitor family I36 protein [Jatrophihabitans sp.]|nr:peptidase inhibitor family I36 protein [Jatrophihabitans sp.]